MAISITQLASLMFSMSRVMREKGDDAFTQVRLEALGFVETQKQPTMKDIAEYFSIRPPTATALVNGLVTDGQLARVTDKRDRRIVRIALTTKGKSTLLAGHKRKLKKIERKFAPLSGGEREELAKMLMKIIAHYQGNQKIQAHQKTQK